MIEISGIAVLTAFLAGVISFLSPCVLPLVPGYLSYIAGRSFDDLQQNHATTPALLLSLFFVLGFSTVFVSFGAGATALGQALLKYRYEANIIGGAVIIVLGLFMTGIVKIPWLQRDFRFNATLQGGHPAAAYVLGLAFAFGWTPCIGPVLGAILTLSAAAGDVSHGVALLAIYSLGLSVPFLVAAAFMRLFVRQLKLMRDAGRILYPIAGVVLIAMGVAMITGYLSKIANWLLYAFPILGGIG